MNNLNDKRHLPIWIKILFLSIFFFYFGQHIFFLIIVSSNTPYSKQSFIIRNKQSIISLFSLYSSGKKKGEKENIQEKLYIIYEFNRRVLF